MVYCTAFVSAASAADTNFEFRITWKQSITNAVWLSDTPPLVYKVIKEPAASQVLIVTRWHEKASNGDVQLKETPIFRTNAVTSKSGEIDMQMWGVLMDGLLRVIENVGGKGTIQVALFEAKKQDESEKQNACGCKPGRQVSAWLELPIKVGMVW
jgi:hypothetical protein